MTSAAVEASDCQVHSPGASKAQKRTNASEKPSRIEIAVMMPWR